MTNPLLEPIHGVSLQDYAAISAKMASGIDVKEICKTLFRMAERKDFHRQAG